jgi:hypothetical protein
MTFFLIEGGIALAVIVFCVVFTFADSGFRPSRRVRVTDRELRDFLKAHAPAAVRPGRVARLLTCCFRRYHP